MRIEERSKSKKELKLLNILSITSEFFRCFVDISNEDANDVGNIAKNYIMRNGAVVSFVLESAKYEGVTHYRIPPESISEVFSGSKSERRAFKLPEPKKKKK
jgi:hypothetical protein